MNMDPHTHTATGETRFKEAGRVEAMDRTLRKLSHRAGLDEKDDKVQINTLVYAMSGNANDVLKSLINLNEKDYV